VSWHGWKWLKQRWAHAGADGELKHAAEMYGRSCVLSMSRAQPSVPFCRTGGFAALVFIAEPIPMELSALCSQLLRVALRCFQPSGGASLSAGLTSNLHLLLGEGGSQLRSDHSFLSDNLLRNGGVFCPMHFWLLR